MRYRQRNPEENTGRTRHIDMVMLIILILLLAFGLIMIFSASTYSAFRDGKNPNYYFNKQLVSTLVGVPAMLVVSLVDYHFVEKLRNIIYLASSALILLILTPLGLTRNGARRWLDFKIISMQPAEVAKIAVILVTVGIIVNMSRQELETIKGMVKVLTPAAFSAALVLFVTSNMSSAIIIFAIAFVILFVATKNWKLFVGMGALAAAMAGITVALVMSDLIPSGLSYRVARIRAWLKPQAYADGDSYQTLQALYSIGSGGIMGKGLGQSIQKNILPEAQNDMIFSIICEELGLFGAIAVILLFVALIWRCQIIAVNAPDLTGALIAVGVLGHIAVQVIFNLAVVTNSMPNTGVTLPFISYGGTSVLFTLMEFGILLNISKEIRLE